jgi:hypothetical protein
MSDPLKAAREMARVTKPGGTLVAAAWDFRGGLVYQRLLWDTAAGIDPAAGATRDRIFANPLAKPEGHARPLAGGGPRRGRTAFGDHPHGFRELGRLLDAAAGGQGPVGSYVAGLEPDLRDRVAAAVRTAYLSGDADGPRSLTATSWVVTGVVQP